MAEAVQINVPFNNPITGFCAFTVRNLAVRLITSTNGLLAQSRHPRQGDLEQPKYLRNYRPSRLWHEQIRPFRIKIDRLECDQESCWAAWFVDEWWTSQDPVSHSVLASHSMNLLHRWLIDIPARARSRPWLMFALSLLMIRIRSFELSISNWNLIMPWFIPRTGNPTRLCPNRRLCQLHDTFYHRQLKVIDN